MSEREKKRHPTVRIEQVDERGTERPPERPRALDGELLAALYRTDDLEAFRQRLDGQIAHDDLLLAREALEALVKALRDHDGESWKRIRAAFSEADSIGDEPTSLSLERVVEPPQEPRASTPSPWVRPWGQAYAPGSVPGSRPPSPPLHGPRHDGYAPAASIGPQSAERGDYRSEGTQLMRYREDRSSSFPPTEGYEPPPPSEPTHPHRSSEPSPSPTPPNATEIVPDSTPARGYQGEEDSATNRLSFFSHAHALALSVEEYAALCAERDRNPDATRSIARRYDVFDADVLAAVERAFELRFARDPALRARWQRAYDTFTAKLRDRA